MFKQKLTEQSDHLVLVLVSFLLRLESLDCRRDDYLALLGCWQRVHRLATIFFAVLLTYYLVSIFFFSE